MDKPITTAEVPPQFLRSAFLVGHIPQRALASDPRISYALYVPPEHYNPNPQAIPDPNQIPPTTTKNNKPPLPLLVHVHGTSRNLTPIHTTLPAFANRTPCAILSPLFPANLAHPNDLDSYAQVTAPTLRSDLALLSILSEIAHVWPGIDTTKIYLMGFSAGGQFAHRFLYLHPERIAAASVGAPGRATMLDSGVEWPAGIKDVDELFGRGVDRDALRDLGRAGAIQLVIGSEDVKVHGGDEFWVWVGEMLAKKGVSETGKGGKGVKVQKKMDHGRMESLLALKKGWEEMGIQTRFDVVEGVAHFSPGVQDCVLAFLGPLMRRGE
ncbi:hypothetical protein BO70DRAFT_390721 [Aspergillus heteromorphus CBS 117.55]|uniref:Carboxylic ester hydrolase n=1 Tax=Aspergillus heteromorphus CBS 117.55 TaxID=1448321 RepID=A0A317V1A7_9EURO|nr:uncharacterized protein BO70DRAFT_390721 [Aspergillus heteromorphus CBS 117.55]PWY65970.1 hypothetical protein BO70DRAFT_390721 [Aspergillus heteromorphus CBS 117.55]